MFNLSLIVDAKLAGTGLPAIPAILTPAARMATARDLGSASVTLVGPA